MSNRGSISKNNEKLEKTTKTNFYFENNELVSIKEFLLSKINSPFSNINYEIRNGDSIQKILQKFKIPNNQIQKVIVQYKKYSAPNKLMVGNKIDIIIDVISIQSMPLGAPPLSEEQITTIRAWKQ